MPAIKKNNMERHHLRSGEKLEDFVYGAIDGTVTTFAVVAGVAGAHLSPAIVLILGTANLLGDGFSMAASDFLSKQSHNEFVQKERRREEQEVEQTPKQEKREISEIYRRKGFRGTLLARVVNVITSNKNRWVDTMMDEELHLYTEQKSPMVSATMTFLFFIIIGFVPLFAYVMAYFNTFFAQHTFPIASLLTGVTFFCIGAVKAELVGKKSARSGFETLLVGGAAATIAYFVGMLLSMLL